MLAAGSARCLPGPASSGGLQWRTRHPALMVVALQFVPIFAGAGDAGVIAMTALYARRYACGEWLRPVHLGRRSAPDRGLALVGSAGAERKDAMSSGHWTIVTRLVAALVLFIWRRWRPTG
ncbi:hypothetical protein HBB16_05805 [Pseudonocardia sp. MCCB 268]|nr:hypothetical protein [Pseudonocardia cytotoxica]